jgi:hypothetical protein
MRLAAQRFRRTCGALALASSQAMWSRASALTQLFAALRDRGIVRVEGTKVAHKLPG